VLQTLDSAFDVSRLAGLPDLKQLALAFLGFPSELPIFANLRKERDVFATNQLSSLASSIVASLLWLSSIGQLPPRESEL
jgi:hypothetical protein